MKACLFVLFCLIVSIYSEDCKDYKPTEASDCYFKNLTDENNTCCFINDTVNNILICDEINFEEYDANKTEILKKYGEGTVISCDSEVRTSISQTNQNYLYVGVLTLLSLLF